MQVGRNCSSVQSFASFLRTQHRLTIPLTSQTDAVFMSACVCVCTSINIHVSVTGSFSYRVVSDDPCHTSGDVISERSSIRLTRLP